MFRGREIVHRDRGRVILDRIVEELGEMAKVDRNPQMEGRTLMMVLIPLKK